ncbi:hypothetical protein ACOME3_005260 [Neoechinorhynchus agilis]
MLKGKDNPHCNRRNGCMIRRESYQNTLSAKECISVRNVMNNSLKCDSNEWIFLRFRGAEEQMVDQHRRVLFWITQPKTIVHIILRQISHSIHDLRLEHIQLRLYSYVSSLNNFEDLELVAVSGPFRNARSVALLNALDCGLYTVWIGNSGYRKLTEYELIIRSPSPIVFVDPLNHNQTRGRFDAISCSLDSFSFNDFFSTEGSNETNKKPPIINRNARGFRNLIQTGRRMLIGLLGKFHNFVSP